MDDVLVVGGGIAGLGAALGIDPRLSLLVITKDAMEQSMIPGSQTFEQALYRLYADKIISIEEALANADSANNLQQYINNAVKPADGAAQEDMTNSVAPGSSFSAFTIKMDS